MRNWTRDEALIDVLMVLQTYPSERTNIQQFNLFISAGDEPNGDNGEPQYFFIGHSYPDTLDYYRDGLRGIELSDLMGGWYYGSVGAWYPLQ